MSSSYLSSLSMWSEEHIETRNDNNHELRNLKKFKRQVLIKLTEK